MLLNALLAAPMVSRAFETASSPTRRPSNKAIDAHQRRRIQFRNHPSWASHRQARRSWSPSARLSTTRITSRAGGGTSDLATGTPGYQTLVVGDGYSIRLYDTHFVVRTAYSRRDEGFDALGSYLDGNNEAGIRIPAPQPVVMTYLPNGSKIMQLFVPSPKEGMPPLPQARGVSLEVAGGQAVAVVEFTGYATKEAATAAREGLLAALAKDGLDVSDDVFLIAQYGPLFSLSTRVNELMVPIKF